MSGIVSEKDFGLMESIVLMEPADWPQVAAIYQEGIATGMATFETEVPPWVQWNASHMETCRLVVRRADEVVAWAAVTPVSNRCVYEGVAEVSIYVSAAVRGQGVGKRLFIALIDASQQAGIWTLQSSVFKANAVSIRLHEQCGFRIMGTRERIAKLHGVWQDTVLLERRSDTVGVD